MTIRACLDSAVAQKQISQATADELDLLYNTALAQFALIHGDAEARRKAQERVAAHLEATAAQKRRVALLQATAIERNWNAVSVYKNARGEVDVAAGLLEMMETHGKRDTGLSTGSLAGRQKAIFAGMVSEFETSLVEFERSILGGRKGAARLENVVRELFGQGTGDDAAKAVAATFSRTAEKARLRYNENGGAIGKLEDWGLPQSHDASAMRRVGFDKWAERIGKDLDWSRMKHALTGDEILPDERIEVLRHVYDTVTTDGWNTRLPSTQKQGRGPLYKQNAEHRFLVFKDADTWLAYQRDFGQGDPFATMMGHLKLMSRDIAAMQMLGPNPEATLTWMKGEVQRQAQNARAGVAALVPRAGEWTGLELRDPVDRTSRILHRVDAMWSAYSGAGDVAVDGLIAATGTTLRNVVTATSLGSAILSAPSDQAFGAFARSFAAGMSIPRSVAHQLGIIVDGIKSSASKEQALRGGIMFDHLANEFGQKAREANAVSGPVMSRFVADQVMRKQGLSALTTTQKNGFGLWLSGELADEAGKKFSDVHAPVQRLLRRYGLDEGDWELIRRARLHDMDANGGGANILRAREIAQLSIDDFTRLLGEDQAGHLAVLQARAEFRKMFVSLTDQVRDQIGAIVTNAPNLRTVGQILAALENTFGSHERGGPKLPEKLRQQIGNTVWSRDGLLRMLEDLRDGTYAVSETARLKFRETAEFQALPDYLKRALSDPEMTLVDVASLLDAMVRDGRQARAFPEGFPSVPSDRALDKFRRHVRDLAERYHEMIVQETTFAVPEATLRSSTFAKEAKAGTLQGELLRSMAQFKGFGTAVVLLHGGRVMNEIAAGRTSAMGAAYLAGAVGVLTMYGMASMQLKQMAKGEDVRDMRDWRSWAGAMVQSGGAGIYGDFLLADQNRLGGGLAATVAGPLAGRIERFSKGTLGNVQQAGEGKKTNAGREAAALLQSLDPTASLWWSKLAMDRLVYSNLRRALDPDASQAMARQERTARKDRGTGYWWRPGEAAPERLPTMGDSAGR